MGQEEDVLEVEQCEEMDRVEQTWVRRLCHLTRSRHFLGRNGEDLSNRRGVWQIP